MALVETEALVLKSYDLADADKIVVLFTRDNGIVRGVAKGVKRLKSKFGSGLEPFTVIKATYFQKEVRELVSIERVDLIKSYFSAASDPEFLEKFAYFTDLLISLLPPHDPSETLYRMVKACLEAGDGIKGSLPAVGVYFELWLLRLSGYLPDMSDCSKCGQKIVDGGSVVFGPRYDTLCEKCSGTGSARTLTGQDRALIFSAFRLGPSEFSDQVIGAGSDLKAISSVFKMLISNAVGRHVASEFDHVR